MREAEFYVVALIIFHCRFSKILNGNWNEHNAIPPLNAIGQIECNISVEKRTILLSAASLVKPFGIFMGCIMSVVAHEKLPAGIGAAGRRYCFKCILKSSK